MTGHSPQVVWVRESVRQILDISQMCFLHQEHTITTQYVLFVNKALHSTENARHLSRSGSSSQVEHGAWGVKDMCLCHGLLSLRLSPTRD